eukprot:scaffold8228_cov267-Pinguiococcus_pyrenoidosus.AAC.1
MHPGAPVPSAPVEGRHVTRPAELQRHIHVGHREVPRQAGSKVEVDPVVNACGHFLRLEEAAVVVTEPAPRVGRALLGGE